MKINISIRLKRTYFIIIVLSILRIGYSQDLFQKGKIDSLVSSYLSIKNLSFSAKINVYLSADLMQESGAKHQDINFVMPVEAEINGENFLYKQGYEGVPQELNDPYVIAYNGKQLQIYKPRAQYLYFTSQKPDKNFTELSGLDLIYAPFEFFVSALSSAKIDTTTITPYSFNLLYRKLDINKFIILSNDSTNITIETTPFNDVEYGRLSYTVALGKNNYLPNSWKLINQKGVIIKDYKVDKWGYIASGKFPYPEIAEENLYSQTGNLMRHCLITVSNIKFSDANTVSFTIDPRSAEKINDADRNLFINTKTGRIIDGETLN